MKREIGYALCAALGLAGVAYWMARPITKRRDTVNCRHQLKQFANNLLQYSREYDEKMPPASKWEAALAPYFYSYYGARDNRTTLPLCPATPGTYAMNAALSGRTLAEFSTRGVTQTPVLFDANTNGAANASAWPIPGRHELRGKSGNNVAFLDGHVKFLTRRPDFNAFLRDWNRPKPLTAPVATQTATPRPPSPR